MAERLLPLPRTLPPPSFLVEDIFLSVEGLHEGLQRKNKRSLVTRLNVQVNGLNDSFSAYLRRLLASRVFNNRRR